MNFADALGYFAGALTAFTFLPQVFKTWKDKSVESISLWMFLIAFFNEILWIWYGVLISNNIIILTNTVMLLMSGAMIFFKLMYGKKSATK